MISLKASAACVVLILASLVTVVPAEARGVCNRNPGDYLGRDGRCHTRATGRSAQSQRDVHHRHRAARRPVAKRHYATPAQAVAPTIMRRPDGSAANQKAFTTFMDRCNEQARKRAEILGAEVRPQINGSSPDAPASCYIPPQISERGAL